MNTYEISKGRTRRIVRATSMLALHTWAIANGYKWVMLGMRSIAEMREDDNAEVIA